MSLKIVSVTEEETRITTSGRFLRIITAAEPVHVRVNGLPNNGVPWQYETIIFAGLGLSFPPNEFPTPMQSVDIRSDVAQKIQIWAGAAAMDDNRTDGLRVSQEGVTGLNSYRVQLGTAVAPIVEAVGGRRRATIQVESGAIYWGGEGVNAETGILLEQGDSAEVESAVAVYGCSVSGNAVLRVLDEVN